MQTVVKISQDYINFEAQIISPNLLNFANELVSFGKGGFKLPINDDQLGEILEYKKVGIYTIGGIQDILVWTGYVADIENDLREANVIIEEEKGFLNHKIIFSDKNYSSTTVPNMLANLVSEANARSGGFEGLLTYSTNLTAVTEKEFKEGTTYADIHDQVAQQLDAEWTVHLNEIIFKDTLGSDKTSGSGQILLESKQSDPNASNITNILIKRNGKAIATRALGIDSSTTSDKTGDTAVFGSIERAQRFDDGGLANQTQEYVDKKSVSQREFDLSIITDKIDFTDVDVGDLLAVEIDHGNVLTQITDSLKVVGKEVLFANAQPQLKLRVAKEIKEINNFSNFLRKLGSRVSRLEKL